MRVFRYNGLLIYLLLLFIITNNVDAQDCTPKCEARKLIRNKDYNYPFVAMLVHAKETQIKLSSVVALGCLISEKWLLTKYTAINTRAKLVAIGFDSLTIPSNLEKVRKNPVLWINRNPKLSTEQTSCNSNIALLRLEKEETVPDALVYWWLRPSKKQKRIRRMESIYWVFNTVNNAFEKFAMPWCPHYTEIYHNCKLKKTVTPTCISAELPSRAHVPGESDTVTQGGPLMIENEFGGIYLGKGPNYLKRDIKPNEHFVARVLARTSVDEDLDSTAAWIEFVIDTDKKDEPFDGQNLTTSTSKSTSTSTITSSKSTTTSSQQSTTTSKRSSTTSGGTTKSTKSSQKTTSGSNTTSVTTVTTPKNVTKSTTSPIYSKTTKKIDFRQLCLMFDDNGSRHQKSLISLLIFSLFFIFFSEMCDGEIN